MSKSIKENYLTLQNGCQLHQASSQREDAVAANLLSNNQKALWVIKQALPQYCIIDATKIKQYPKVFNRIGVYCWHQYQSNPELIEVAYANSLYDQWTIAGKIRLQKVADRQYFKLKQIPATQMRYLKVSILQNFGDKNTYLNKIELGYQKQSQSQAQPKRQKNFSQYVKLTSTQRELKRVQDQMKVMRNQHEQLKSTVIKQNQLIVKLQEDIKLMAKYYQKVCKLQSLQNEKSKLLEYKNKGSSIQKHNQQDRVLQYRQENCSRKYCDESSEEDVPQKKFREQQFMHQKTVSSKNKSISYAKSNKQSIDRIKEMAAFPPKRQKYNKMLKLRQANDSSPYLSEYNQSQNERSMQSQKCTQLVIKLQKLLAQREKRTKEHNRRSQHRQYL